MSKCRYPHVDEQERILSVTPAGGGLWYVAIYAIEWEDGAKISEKHLGQYPIVLWCITQRGIVEPGFLIDSRIEVPSEYQRMHHDCLDNETDHWRITHRVEIHSRKLYVLGSEESAA